MSDLLTQASVIETEASTQELSAWILPISANASVAVGRYELKYIEYINASVSLPGLPAFCEQGFVWRNRFVPVLDIQSLITRRRMPATETEQLAAIIAYENAQGELALGAILLRGVPKLSIVKPSQSVAVTQLSSELQLLAQAAFKDENSIYAVLDLRSLFDRTPVDLLSLH
jgi:chemotaxis signal transduction protein